MASILHLFVLCLLLLGGTLSSQDINETLLDSEEDDEASGKEPEDILTSTASTGADILKPGDNGQLNKTSDNAADILKPGDSSQLNKTSDNAADILKPGDNGQLNKTSDNAAGSIFFQCWTLPLVFVLICTCRVYSSFL